MGLSGCGLLVVERALRFGHRCKILRRFSAHINELSKISQTFFPRTL
jgi:hypothetical protein